MQGHPVCIVILPRFAQIGSSTLELYFHLPSLLVDRRVQLPILSGVGLCPELDSTLYR